MCSKCLTPLLPQLLDPPPVDASKSKGKGRTPPAVDRMLVSRYKVALDCAVRAATKHNVSAIPGTAIIMVDVSDCMQAPCTAARGLGKPKTVQEVALLMGIMASYAAERAWVRVACTCLSCFLIVFGLIRELSLC
jgi:hypothetical protein